eukprot:16386449-Heterocapsa_arctica.AAC.1
MAFAAAPVAKGYKGKGGGKAGKNATGAGRPPWAAGGKITDNAMLHRSYNFFPKYTPVPSVGADGASSAAWEGLAQGHIFVSAEAFANSLDASKTEIVNRPTIGLSEYAGTIECLHANLTEDGAVFHPTLQAKWLVLVQQHDVIAACQMLNTVAYPHLQRTVPSVQTAVSSILTFAQAMRQDWDYWSLVFARLATGVVCASWALTMAALTVPGAYADKAAPVPMKAITEKAALMADRLHGGALVNFISAELLAELGLRLAAAPAAAAAAAAPAAFVGMQFN